MSRVLVLDDDTDVRTTVADILIADGHDVQTAGSCDDALVLVQRAAPDVILLDMRFEDGDDGDEFARRYRLLPEPHAALVLFSALPTARESAQRLGASAVLSKPFHVRELLEIVARHSAPTGAP